LFEEELFYILQRDGFDHPRQDFYLLYALLGDGKPVIVQTNMLLSGFLYQPLERKSLLTDEIDIHKILGFSPVEESGQLVAADIDQVLYLYS
jgi:hypothetical protein